jgi:LemA protein
MKLSISGFFTAVLFITITLSSCVSVQAINDLEDSVSRDWTTVYESYMDRATVLVQTTETVRSFADQERESIEGTRKAIEAVRRYADRPPEEILADHRDFSELNDAYFELRNKEARLLIVTENYPELRSNQNFLTLADELSTLENTTATSISRYNETAADANSYVSAFPRRLSPRVHQNQKWPLIAIPERLHQDSRFGNPVGM